MTDPSLPRLLAWLSARQSKHPWRFVWFALLSLVPAILATSGLGFKPDFTELLPDNKDSVIELRRIASRLPGISTLTVVAEIADSQNSHALEAFVDALVPRLKTLGPAWVGGVDYGVHDARKFFESHKLLFAKTEDLQTAHHDILERYDYEIAKRRGDWLDEEDAPAPITAQSIRNQLEGKKTATPPDEDFDSYPDGYYLSKDRKLIAVLVRSPVEGKAATEEFKEKVARVVEELAPKQLDPSMEVRYTGDLITSAEEYNAVIHDLGRVGAWGVAGVLGSILLFFLRIRTVLTMGATLLVGLLWTFGLTRFTIGYLNSSTGFLVSIIAGNGINYGIMYMARYIEARRDEGATVESAITIAHRDSWLPTLASAATAMLAYGSLVVTDFRGFKHFGIIGSYGMLLCWFTTYLFMPPILAASENVLPTFRDQIDSTHRTRARGYYGVAFAKLSHFAPRTITILGVLWGIASIVVTVRYLASDPMEYNMFKIRNEITDRTAATELSARVDEIVGRLGQDGMAVMTDRLDQIPMLDRELQKRYDAAPEGQKPFEKVVTIFSLLPKDQEDKVPLINEMRGRILHAHTRGFFSDSEWAELESIVPAQEVKAVTFADLPEQVARPFTEKDGTRGRIVYIVPKSGFSVSDAKYLMRWADSFRYTRLPTGEVIKGSGRAVIFADMIQTIGEDAPKAMAVSAIGSILVILIAFRGRKQALGVFIPWLIGVTGLFGFLYWRDIKLNFLNFVAAPITIGIGAEYAHNLMQRYRVEGDGKIYHVVMETGGAVILCSLTTTIGYLALMLSINHGIVSFGLAAAAGEITCVLAAVLGLPSFLVWRAHRRRAQFCRAATAHFQKPPGSLPMAAPTSTPRSTAIEPPAPPGLPHGNLEAPLPCTLNRKMLRTRRLAQGWDAIYPTP